MSLLFGKKSPPVSQEPKQLHGLRVTTSSYGEVIRIIYGTHRVAGTLLDYDDFKAIPHVSNDSTGGKNLAGGGSTPRTSYTYQAAVMIALCQGPMSKLLSIWNTKGKKKLVTVQEQKTVPVGGGAVSVNDPTNAYEDLGVTALAAYSVSANDYGSPGPVTLAGNQDAPFVLVAASPAAGQYSYAAGVYTFNAADAGKTIKLNYSKAVPESASTGIPLSKWVFTLFKGTRPQSVWGYMSTNHPTKAQNYNGIAYLANSKMDLGTNGDMPNLNYEVVGLFPFGGGVIDANPKDVYNDIITNVHHAAGLDLAYVGTMQKVSDYCVANGIFISPVLDTQKSALDWLRELLPAANAAAIWSDGKIKLISLGDSTAVGNGVTFTPNTTPIYDLTPDDFVGESGKAGINVRIRNVAEAKNIIPIEYSDRSHDYNADVVYEDDPGAVALYGRQQDSVRKMPWITSRDVAAKIGRTAVLRSVNILRTYEFTLPARYQLLEPGDLVTVTDTSIDPDFVKRGARIISIEEDAKENLKIVAEEFPYGVGPTLYPKQPGTGFTPDSDADPGNVNAPIIFETSGRLNGSRGNQIFLAVSGASANWGGCSVWVAIGTSTTYKLVGRFEGKSRTGVLTAALAIGTDPDTINTLSVDLTQSLGTLSSGTQAEADNLQTLIYVDGEIMAYQTATLTAANKYNLTYLRRGVFQSAIAAHNNAMRFARLDASLFMLPYDPLYIGQTLHIKLTSFNTQLLNEQALASVADYTYVVSGAYSQDDVAFAGAPQSLTGQWTKGAGYNFQWKPPATASLTIDGYYCFVRAPDGTYMDLQTGQAAAVQTEAGARVFVPDTHKGIRKSKGELAEPFKSSGAAMTVWAVNRKDGIVTESPNRATSNTIVPTTDLGEFATPTGVSISSITSTAATVPGSSGRHYDLAVVVAWTGLASRVEVQVTVGTKVHSQHVAVNQTGGTATVYFAHKFKLGDSVSCIAKVRNGTAESAFTGATIHTVGGGSVGTIAGLTSLTRTETKQHKNIYSATWALNTALRRLIIYKGGVWHHDIKIAKPDASGNLSCDITSLEFEVLHAQGATISVGAQLEDSAGQLSAITTETGATPSPSDDAAPAAPTLISVVSSIDPIDGTKGVKASATITVGLPGVNQTSCKVVLLDNTNGKKHHREIELAGTETSVAIEFDQFAKVGHSITITRIRLWNRSAYTDTDNPFGGSFTAGGGASIRPAAPSLSLIKRFTNKTKYQASLGLADTNIRQLQIWSKANPAGLVPADNDPNPAGWTAEESKNVHGPAKAGATTFNFSVHHRQDERLDIVARFVNSNGDLGIWSAVLDAGAVPETDAAAPTAVAITSVTSDADPLPNNTGRQFIVSVGVSWSGPANQVDGKITVNAKDHAEHVPVDTLIGSVGNAATIVFSKLFKQGQSGTIQVRVRNGNAKSAWVAYSLNPFIIGGSGGTLASPAIAQFERNPYNAIYAVTWTPNADLAYLQVQKQKADLTWVDQPKVDITSIASVGAVHVTVEVKGALANTAVFPNVRVRLQDTSGNLSAWVQLNGASQPSGTEFFIDNPTGWIDGGKLGLIGTGASANLSTVISQRTDGNKTLVPNLMDAIWQPPISTEDLAIGTVNGRYKSNIPNGQFVSYLKNSIMRLGFYDSVTGLWHRFTSDLTIGGGSSGVPSSPPSSDGGTCFAADSLVLLADASPRTIGEIQVGDDVLGVDMCSGEEIAQRVTGVVHHDPAEFIIWNFLRMSSHRLFRWCPDPHKHGYDSQTESKPPGLCEQLTPEVMHLGQKFWSRIDGVIQPFEHRAVSTGEGAVELVSLMTSGKTYWVGDGRQFVLAHNVKVLP